jgi:hypothetical protein
VQRRKVPLHSIRKDIDHVVIFATLEFQSFPKPKLEIVGDRFSSDTRIKLVSKRVERHSGQGCQIFLGAKYQNGESLPNDHKPNQSALYYAKWP